MATTKPVPANALTEALAHVAKGGRLVIRTYLRTVVIDRKLMKRFEKAGAWLLQEDGEGYRLRDGKGSVCVLPGQLEYVIE